MLKQLKAITNGTRHQFIIQKNFLFKSNKIIKAYGYKKFVGRSSLTGRITVRHKGGGRKHLYKLINFSNKDFIGIILGILYDPNRNSFISCVFNLLTLKFFNTLTIENVFPGALISCQSKTAIYFLGGRYPIKNISAGSLICLLSQNKFKSAQLIRSAGTYGTLLQLTDKVAVIRAPSSKLMTVDINNYITLGGIYNNGSNIMVLGKAGKARLKGRRPTVRGIAMNPVDHPHGGRSNGGIHPRTPWGKPTKGVLTGKKYDKK
jgi:large subunit ribosomal protein L2